MIFPRWLDPTPQTLAFLAGFAGLPVREPFVKLRKQMKTGLPFSEAAKLANQRRHEEAGMVKE